MKINLQLPTEYQDVLCKTFSHYVLKSNTDEYAKRNQDDHSKVRLDIYHGKRAEYMVYNYFLSKNRNVSAPDIMIYDKSKKSYDADLTIDSINIHVKSTLDDSEFPNSWVFQPNDPLVKCPTENDYLALCVLCKEPYMYLIKSEGIEYQKPIKKSLNKSVIYEKQIA